MSHGVLGPMFHGTARPIEVGAVITPGAHTANFNPGEEHAYATTSEVEARWYAEKAHQRRHTELERNSHLVPNGQWRDAESQVQPRIYSVEPVGDVEKDPRDGDGGSRGSALRSRAGFRVTGEVPYVSAADEARKALGR